MAIDANQPVRVIEAMRVDMVHAFGVPAGPRRLEHRAFWYFALGILCGGQCRDLKGADLPTIKWGIILSIAYDAVAKHRHPSTRAGAMRVGLNERILGMRPPRPEERVSVVEAQRIVLEGGTAHEHPPLAIGPKEGWVSVLPGQHFAHTGPGGREIDGSIDANGIGFQRFRHHIVSALPGEYIRIRQVEGFLQDHALIAPAPSIVTRGQADDTTLPLRMHHLKEHAPGLLYPEHKGIGDERCGDIRDLRCSEHGVVRGTRRSHMQWRCPCVDADRPDVRCCYEHTLLPYPSQYAALALAAFTRRSISSSVKPAILRASREMLIDT